MLHRLMRHFALLLLLILGVSSTQAQVPINAPKPMILPVAGEPSPSTWMLGQAYGNTTGAFNFGTQWYRAGQGLHFGLDLSMPCGTPLVAVADGTVQFVDDMGFGSAPHNLIIRHDALGLTSLYGHLLQPSMLMPGQLVVQGQLVGYSGDPDETCDSRPHLHLEIRSLDYSSTINPVNVIEANWHTLALIGPYGYPLFQQDLQNPRRWMSLDNQPDVRFWGQILNSYNVTTPPPSNRRPNEMPLLPRELTPTPSTYSLSTVTPPGCCANPQWHPADPARFFTMDGNNNETAGVYEWSLSGGGGVLMRPAPLPVYSPMGIYALEPFINNTTRITAADGTQYTVDSGGRIPTVNPANTRLLWSVSDGVAVPGQMRPVTRIYVSNVNGEGTREILAQAGADARWLDNERILISVRDNQRRTALSVYSLVDDSLRILGNWYELRGLSTSPGGRYVMFYLAWQQDPATNGVYVLDTQAEGIPSAQALAWFGAWRWRDAHTLYYIPYQPQNPIQQLRLYDLRDSNDIALTDPAQTPFSIANGHWEVSADGQRILFQQTTDYSLAVLQPSS